MFRLGIILSLEEDETKNQRIVRRSLRDTSNPLELPDPLFHQHYRLNKDAFSYVLNLLAKEIAPSKKSFAIPPILKLSACLRFFAEGGYQKGVGRDYEIGMAQSTFSEVLNEVLPIIAGSICPKWIIYPNEQESRTIAQEFYSKFGIPSVVGCIDGTHINIITPQHNKHLYYNRKGKFSLNVTLICDSQMKIRYVNAKHPGGCHDSFVYTTSSCRRVLEQDYLQKGYRFWLLGDGGYPLEPWLLTPYRNPTSGSVEQKFNDVHAKCRNIIERTNGVLKNRWRCLLGARELHYEPEKAIKIINACVALHNICISFKCEYDVDIANEVEQSEPLTINNDYLNESTRYLAAAQRIRTNITNSL